MNNELKPYDGYKKAPFQWLDSIPLHWKYKRAKAMYSKANRPVREMDEVVTCFRDGVVTLRKNRRTTGFTESIKEIGYQGIRKGDLVIHVMDAFAGAIGVSDSDGKSTPVYSVCVPKEDLNNYYYAYIVREMAKTGFIQSLYRGIRERSSDFRFEVFTNQYLPIPPIEEQYQIVKYLDFQLARINKFIKAKKKLIEVLKEQKQTVINEAVTKGINPNVKMKPSGIEWLGDIPEHWELIRIKNCISNVINGTWGEDPTPKNITNHLICIRVADFDMNNLSVSEKKLTVRCVDKNKNKNRILCKGDLLIEKSGGGEKQPVGRVIMFDNGFDAVSSNFVAKINVNKNRVKSEYLLFCLHTLQSLRLTLPFITQTTGIQNLDEKNYFNSLIALPPLDEQEKITKMIRNKTEIINKSINGIEKEIELITEYRTTLISDVVTGKVDVRHIQIDDIIEEDTEIDETEDEIIDEEDVEIEESEE